MPDRPPAAHSRTPPVISQQKHPGPRAQRPTDRRNDRPTQSQASTQASCKHANNRARERGSARAK
eukprot:626664-Alexandrium_andersonii.AAC.1